MTRSTVPAACLALLLLASGAHAGWSVKGALEPDTLADVQDGWMTLDPNAGFLGHTLYFNGFGAPGGPVQSTIDPNLGLVASSVRASPYLAAAMLGVWRDCNRDGYVGLGDQGLLEYSSRLLLDDATCPAGTPDPSRPWATHNDGTWVVELMSVGYDDVTTPGDSNPLTVNDTYARVWADWGVPGDAPTLTCTAVPAPNGAFRSTGGFLRWTDCYTGHRLVPAASETFEAAGLPQFSFRDAPADRPDLSGSQLNVANPWGGEADEPAFVVFDCADAEEVEIEDPTGGSLHHLAAIPMPDGSVFYVNGTDSEGNIANATIPRVDPTTGSGSPAGTVNQTQAALTDCDRDDAGEVLDLDGHPDGSDAELPYALEGGAEPVSAFSPRTRTDHVLSFEEGSRGGDLSLLLGSRVRGDAGAGTFAVTGFWIGTTSALTGPNPYVGRAELALLPVTHITYYAYVSPAALARNNLRAPNPLPGFYGAEACALSPATFDCDPARWWRDASGQDITPRDPALGEDPNSPGTPEPTDFTKIGVSVWQPYTMRDIDCIDTSFSPAREIGLHWGLVTGTACIRP